MDIAFLLGVAALWAVMALLIFGFKKLEKPAGTRPRLRCGWIRASRKSGDPGTSQTLVNSGDDGRQLAGDFHAQALASLVLDNPERAVTNIRPFQLQHVGWTLFGKQC